VAGGQSPGAATADARGIGGTAGSGRVPESGTSFASMITENKAECRLGNPKVDVRNDRKVD
jgi:hypothetical protein